MLFDMFSFHSDLWCPSNNLIIPIWITYVMSLGSFGRLRQLVVLPIYSINEVVAVYVEYSVQKSCLGGVKAF